MSRRLVRNGVLLIAIAGAALAGCGGGAPKAGSAADAVAWGHDLPAALARAGSEKKLVMVDFYTDWCRWCKVLDQTTFADEGVQRALRGVVPVRLNAEKDGRDVAEKFNVDGYPTVIFLNASGAEVGRIPGYLAPEPFLAELDNIIKRG